MKHILLFTWVGVFLFIGAIIAGISSIGDYEVWLDFANTVLLISIAISLLHIARRSS